MEEHYFHFLDSNIILSKVIDEKNETWVFDYFKKDFNKSTSINVFEESEKFLSKNRQITLSYLKHIKEESIANKNSNLTSEKVKNSFIDYYCSKQEYPFKLSQQRFKNIVEGINEKYPLEIYKLINDPNKNFYEKFRKEILNIFKDANINLVLFKQDEITVCPKSYCFDKGKNKYSNMLTKIGLHYPDTQHVLDCCSFSKHSNHNIAFITNDKGIYNHKDEIIKTLSVPFFSPRAFYGN